MCGRYALTTPADVLARLFDLTAGTVFALPDNQAFGTRYNIAPSQMSPVIRDGPFEDQGRRLDLLYWGLVPFWARDPHIGSHMINARSETAAEKPAFREALRKRRCIVPADGFYEWQTLDGHKQPFFVQRADGLPMAMAGLWERWKGPANKIIDSYTIMTTTPNEQLRSLHDRMPVILDADGVDRWLHREYREPDDVTPLLKPIADGVLRVYPVSTRVNRPANDDATLIEEVKLEGPEAESEGQMGLF